MSLHKQLVKTSFVLAKRTIKPTQVDLRRAVSTAYYAMFHALAENNANCFISKINSDGKAERAWRQTYRALEHGLAKSACEQCTGKKSEFPAVIKQFSLYFVSMQERRHSADYDPSVKFIRAEVLSEIESTKIAIEKFVAYRSTKHKQAFAALVLFKSRK